jgi:hypothetical protein
MLFVNDDMYFPSYWDKQLPLGDSSVITFIVVEPGYVQVNERNIEHNFGLDWNKFKMQEFEKFAIDFPERYTVRTDRIGWYMPVIFPRSLFMAAGKYPETPPFPNPNDVVFFENLRKMPKIDFLQVMSPVYHFQRLSQRDLGAFMRIRLRMSRAKRALDSSK